MTLSRIEKITCPTCGQTTDFTLWDSINATENPELKEKTLDGSMFECVCEHCGSKFHVAYNTIYHDMRKKIFIQYLNSDERSEEAVEMFNSFPSFSIINMPNQHYIKRLVDSPHIFLEEVRILDMELDDRIVEIAKIYAAETYLREHPGEKNIRPVFAHENDKNYILLVVNDEFHGDCCVLDDGLYKSLCDEFLDKLPSIWDTQNTLADVMAVFASAAVEAQRKALNEVVKEEKKEETETGNDSEEERAGEDKEE